MVPEMNGGNSPDEKPKKVMNDKFMEEAIQQLADLGYPSNHPIFPSLIAHITRKPAVISKLEVELFLAEQCQKAQLENGSKAVSMERTLDHIRNDKKIQQALILENFKGCDLKFSNDAPNSSK